MGAWHRSARSTGRARTVSPSSISPGTVASSISTSPTFSGGLAAATRIGATRIRAAASAYTLSSFCRNSATAPAMNPVFGPTGRGPVDQGRVAARRTAARRARCTAAPPARTPAAGRGSVRSGTSGGPTAIKVATASRRLIFRFPGAGTGHTEVSLGRGRGNRRVSVGRARRCATRLRGRIRRRTSPCRRPPGAMAAALASGATEEGDATATAVGCSRPVVPPR